MGQAESENAEAAPTPASLSLSKDSGDLLRSLQGGTLPGMFLCVLATNVLSMDPCRL